MSPISEAPLEKILVDIFGGNPYYAKAKESNGDITYSPVEVPLSEDAVHDHLEGKTTLGSYQLLQGANVVRWLGWDVDSVELKTARETVLKILRHVQGMPHAVEFSGRKGYHVLIFLTEPMSATEAKKVVDWVREKEGFSNVGDNHVECYPKQDKLSRSRPKGSLLKIPLGYHPRTHDRSRFVDPYNGWENGNDLDPCEILSNRVHPEDVLALVDVGPDPTTELIQLVSEHWKDGKRHELALYLSGYLAHEGWGVEQTKRVMQAVVESTGDDQGYNRLQTVETTFIRTKEGKSVRGRQGLGEILPLAAMQRLTELVSRIKAPDTVGQIDDIRFNKTRSVVENARLASNTIWSILTDDNDRIFQSNRVNAFWYSSKTHLLTEEGSEMWQAMLNEHFGLNPVDAFSRLVYRELRLRIVRDAPILPVRNRTYWDEGRGKLFVNLGGPEVYIISGEEEIQQSYNGECGIMFRTRQDEDYLIPDLECEPVDAWDYLVNDMSFTVSDESPAKPEEQRELLKAWILAYFFQEMMPTKPILTLLGEAGSGKTTAARRIYRILEDLHGDVLGVPTDKQDAFRASIARHRMLTLDNLEKSGAYWMVDMLNKLATGSNIELRELYTSNQTHTITPECFVAITAVNMPFSDETLFSRLLCLEMDTLGHPAPEHVLQRRILENASAIWGDLLRKLNHVVATLRAVRVTRPSTRSRLVDFTSFCDRIKTSGVLDGERLSLGLLSMVNTQMRQLKESSQAIQLLEEWISMRPEEANQWRNFTDLYTTLSTMAQTRRVDFRWKSGAALARHILALEDRLTQDLGAQFRSSFQNHREVHEVRFETLQVVGSTGVKANGSA